MIPLKQVAHRNDVLSTKVEFYIYIYIYMQKQAKDAYGKNQP